MLQICGLLLSAAGAYGMYFTAVEIHGEKDSLELAYIVITDLSGVLLALGIIIWIVSFAGCVGALRENLCLLKLVRLLIDIILASHVKGVLIYWFWWNLHFFGIANLWHILFQYFIVCIIAFAESYHFNHLVSK